MAFRVVHDHIHCDGCQQNPLIGIRYKCSVCPNFDLCEDCLLLYENRSRRIDHPVAHTFYRLATPVSLRHKTFQNTSSWKHNITCSACREDIVGYRYFCSQCGISLCAHCEQVGSHRLDHNLLKTVPVDIAEEEAIYQAQHNPSSPHRRAFPEEQLSPIRRIHHDGHNFFPGTVENQINEFGDNLSQELSADFFISPFSIFIALLLLVNGTKGVTQREVMQTIVPLDSPHGVTLEDLNHDTKKILYSIRRSGFVHIANSIWASKNSPFRFRRSYMDDMESIFFAQAQVAGTIDDINDWCNDKTNGKISSIVQQLPDLSLVNAVHFKANWLKTFDENSTRTQRFYKGTDREVSCEMMSLNTSLVYHETEGYQSVMLPYERDTGFVAVVVLSRHSNYDGKVRLPWERIWRDLQDSNEKNGLLKLPRFRVESELDIKEYLQAIGIRNAFQYGNQEFGSMIADPYPERDGVVVDKVIHKVFVDVNELGTEAAAASLVSITRGANLDTLAFEMICDRPFNFYICDNDTGMRLFMGHVRSPTQPDHNLTGRSSSFHRK